MNNNRESKILQIIKSNPDWRKYFEENYGDKIHIKEEGNFAIFKYMALSDFNDPVVKEARGIIIDTFNCEVVCFPFDKFGKYDDYYADEIDWSTAKVQEKIDGSIIKMWFNKYTSEWQFSSMGVIDARNALSGSGKSLYDILVETSEYIAIRKNINYFDKDFTYIFELVSEYNRVVIKYNTSKLYLTGIRNNVTGKEYEPNIPFLPNPIVYPLTSLEECINYVTNVLNNTNDKMLCTNEGFVVVDKNYNRIKIKSPIYMILHHVSDMTITNKARICDFIYNNSIDIQNLTDDFSSSIHILKFYEYQISEFLYNVSAIIDISKKLNNQLKDRKAIAQLICGHRYSQFGFAAISNPEMTDKEILEYCARNNKSIGHYIAKNIPDYEPLPDNRKVWDGFDKLKS